MPVSSLWDRPGVAVTYLQLVGWGFLNVLAWRRMSQYQAAVKESRAELIRCPVHRATFRCQNTPPKACETS